MRQFSAKRLFQNKAVKDSVTARIEMRTYAAEMRDPSVYAKKDSQKIGVYRK